MGHRPVTHVRRDRNGVTIGIGNPGAVWSVRGVAEVIRDIELRPHTYYVPWTTGRAEIRVVDGVHGKYLRTDRDNTERNNLGDLPSI